MAKYHIYGWYLSRTRISQISRIYFSCKQRVFSFGLNGKTPKESRIREIREIRVGKFNIIRKWIYEVTPSRS